MTVTTICVSDMHCAACTSKIRQLFTGLEKVQRLQFNPVKRQVFVTHADDLPHAALLNQLETAGFHPQLIGDVNVTSPDQSLLLKRLGLAGLAMMQVMMVQIALYAGAFQGMEDGMRRFLEYTALVFCIPVVAYSAVPFFSRGLRSLRPGLTMGLNMDTPIALAIALAFITSLVSTVRGTGAVYYDSVVMFTFLMLGARYLEQRLRFRLGVEDSLLAALPKWVTRVSKNQHQQVALDQVEIGDELWVAQGVQVPSDGILISARAILEDAWLTGEADWQHYTQGSAVRAGSVNTGAGFTMRVTTLPADSRVAEIDQLANVALDAKHELARLADSVARVFIPTILLLALTTYLVWSSIDPSRALSIALAVLVVSCPCALSLATPAALTAALARLRQAGILVKNTRALETLKDLTDIYFDKTGTLTDPQPKINKVRLLGGYTEKTSLEYAAALQKHSTHPLAKAFAGGAMVARDARDARDVTLHTGSGVQGLVEGALTRIGTAEFCGCEPLSIPGDKAVYLSINSEPAAVFELTNVLRHDARSTVAALQRDGVKVHLLSGDNPANCDKIATELQITSHSSTAPEDKPKHLLGTGEVMFVGDGINDLPALAAADISVSTLETADLVKSKADIVLLTRKLGALLDLVNIGRATSRIMRQNLFWALFYNMLAIPLAALGYVPPWGAALGMSVSSIAVMLNASRLLRAPLEVSQ